MQTIIATFDEIARRALGAERLEIAELLRNHDVLTAAVGVMTRLGLTDGDAATGSDLARTRSVAAIDAAQGRLAARQQALIDRTARPDLNLHIMPTPTTLVGALKSADDTIIHLCRNHGEGFEAILDGKRLGDVQAYDISTDRTTLVIGELWTCPIDDIEAVGDEDGLFVILRDGTLLEVRKTA